MIERTNVITWKILKIIYFIKNFFTPHFLLRILFLIIILILLSGCETQVYSKYYISEDKVDLHIHTKSKPVYLGEEFASARVHGNEYWHQSNQACVERIASFERKKISNDVI